MLLALLLACDPPAPTFVDKTMIEKAHIHGDLYIICAGLTMKDESTRGFAADTLTTMEPAPACLCEHMIRDGAWDLPVVRSMAKGQDDAHVGCAATLLDKPELTDRAGLVNQLARIKVPAVQARIVTAAKGDADPAVRAAAMAVLRPAKNPDDLALVTAALSDTNPALRAAAATALVGVDGATESLVAAAKDPDAAVRVAAITALKGTARFAEVACPVLEADPDPAARASVAAAFQGTKDPAALACLREHMLEQEDDGLVRAAMLGALRKTRAPEAAQTLCDAIPFWVKTYIGEDKPEREGPSDIIFAQNDRDFEKSWECVQKAVRAGGYKTCEQRFYVNDWFSELGGGNPKPRPCKMPAGSGGGGGGGGGEIVF